MDRATVQSVKEQMSDLIKRYLGGTDLDHFTAQEIWSNICDLDRLLNIHSQDYKLSTILGLINQILNHLYVARGLATPDIPRPWEYYKRMNAAKQLFRKIRDIR
jgi:hypothetical protein